jgi:quercetin dioxygenase-like cupin family protein
MVLGEALGVTIAWFFNEHVESATELEPLIRRREDKNEIAFVEQSIRKQLLGPDPERPLQMFIIEILPGGSTGATPYAHGAESIALVLEGNLTLDLKQQRYYLREGDSFVVPAHMPRRLCNPDRDCATRLIWAVARFRISEMQEQGEAIASLSLGNNGRERPAAS